MRARLPQLAEKRLIGTVAVSTLALWIGFYNLGLESTTHFIPILGWFLVIPLILVLGDRFPLVASDQEAKAKAASKDDPAIEALRTRYAHGAIDERDFERRLENLLRTQEITWRYEHYVEDFPETGFESAESTSQIESNRHHPADHRDETSSDSSFEPITDRE